MADWMTYQGLELPDSPTADAGNKLTENLKLLADGLGSGLPVEADSFVVVQRGADDFESAANLCAVYAAAKQLTPGGNALSATNRATVLVPPGRYDFGTGDSSNHGLVLDAEFVDLVGLSAVREDAVLTSQIATASRGTTEQTANDVRIANLSLDINAAGSVGSGNTIPSAYFPSTNLSGTKMDNVACSASVTRRSMRVGIEYSGTFTNCTGGLQSFGGSGGTAGGTFTDCHGEVESFGGNSGIASGTFISCSGDTSSFAGSAGTASGTFVKCVGGFGSFAGDTGIASGTFIDCVGGPNSFVSNGGTASGTFTNCISGPGSFGVSSTASGVFTNCFGGSGSFGGGGGSASGHFVGCALGTKSGGATTFGASDWGGTLTGIMDGCYWKVTGTNQTALRVGAGARVYNSTLIGTGTGKSIDAASAGTHAVIAQCRLNKGIGTNVVNDIATPYNVDDADIS